MIPSESKKAGSNEWYTPAWLVEAATDVLGSIDLDPASNVGSPNVPASQHYTVADNGLSQEWKGRVFLNPPWSETGKWITKALEELEALRMTEAVLVIRGLGFETRAYQALLEKAVICFLRGRVNYLSGDGRDAVSPTQGTIVAYLGSDPSRFIEKFSSLGIVVTKLGA
jgi:phage N-6-adenine-methyltransferase